jgi:hydrogenase maturation protease
MVAPSMSSILVAGLGNLLMSDDGVGVHAVRALRDEPLEGALALEVGTAALDALPYLERAEHVIALDALEGGRPPGTLYRYTLGEQDARPPGGCLHELDLAATLYMLELHERPEVLVLGVQPERLELGLTLSPKVEASLPHLLEAVRETVRELAARRPVPLLV